MKTHSFLRLAALVVLFVVVAAGWRWGAIRDAASAAAGALIVRARDHCAGCGRADAGCISARGPGSCAAEFGERVDGRPIQHSTPATAHTTNAGNTGFLQSVQNIAGTNYLTLTFRRRLAPGGIILHRCHPARPSGRGPGAPVLVGAPAPNGNGMETVTYRDSVPVTPAVPQRFIRHQVTRGPQAGGKALAQSA